MVRAARLVATALVALAVCTAPMAAVPSGRVPAQSETVAEHLSAIAAQSGADVSFTDQQPCGTVPRPGVWNPAIGYLAVEGCFWDDTPGVIYLSPAASDEEWASLSDLHRGSWTYLLAHELSHRDVYIACGTSRPEGHDNEALADAWTYVVRGVAAPPIDGEPGWSHGFGPSDVDAAELIAAGRCSQIGETDD